MPISTPRRLGATLTLLGFLALGSAVAGPLVASSLLTPPRTTTLSVAVSSTLSAQVSPGGDVGPDLDPNG